MSSTVKAKDWEAQGVAQVGGAQILGGAVYFFAFRSRSADCWQAYIFAGAGVGFGGSIGGGSGPSPADIAQNITPDMWSPIKCARAFSADDLDLAYAAITTVAFNAAYGYAGLGISAGLVDSLFDSADVSGWGTGIGAIGAIFIGVWKSLGDASGYR